MRRNNTQLAQHCLPSPARARGPICCLQVQEAIIKRAYGLLKATANGTINIKPALSHLKQEICLAAKTNTWASWPFPAHSDTKLVRDHDLTDLLFAAYHNRKLKAMLQLLHVLILSLPASSMHSCGQLETFLDHLTMASKTPSLPASCIQLIQDLVDVLAPVQLAEPILLASEQPQHSAAAMLRKRKPRESCQSHSRTLTHAAVQSPKPSAVNLKKTRSTTKAASLNPSQVQRWHSAWCCIVLVLKPCLWCFLRRRHHVILCTTEQPFAPRVSQWPTSSPAVCLALHTLLPSCPATTVNYSCCLTGPATS